MAKKYYPLLIVAFILLSFSHKNKRPKPLFDAKKLEESLKLIPGSIFNPDERNYYWSYSIGDSLGSIKIDSFYISAFEVSNIDYLTFLNSIQKRDSVLYKKMLPDTLAWLEFSVFCGPDMFYYFKHPKYVNYPALGVTYEQAQVYCLWLTNMYMAAPKRKFSKVRFVLPTKSQWILAALGRSHRAWNYVPLERHDGKLLANFRLINQSSIERGNRMSGNRNDSNNFFYVVRTWQLRSPITEPVKSYWPSEYGLYNMHGNVEEFVREKGITKGGSWNDPGYYLQYMVEETYDTTQSTSAERGFRVAMEIIK